MTQKKLGRYDLIRVLGKGAMGLVYEGRDPNLDRRVAIKTIKVENLSEEAAAEYEARFRTEARSAARLQHPNIVSVYDSDRDGDIAFLVMEFVQGEDLKHHLDQGKRYTLEQTLAVMHDLLSALEYAHKAKIVHRDIKPANLLIEASGRVKLTDFGVARIQDSGDATRTHGSMVGTLKYMSPEQVQGKPVDSRSDLFAAGVVLYQLLTGKRPFDGDSDFAIIQRIVAQDAKAPSSINSLLPPAMDAVVARALAKSRDQRYATAQEFAAALQACAAQAGDSAAMAPAPAPVSGKTATWTGTVRAGESLLDTQSGSGTGTGTGGSTVAQELELVYWKDIKESSDVEDLQGFLARFPSGVYADLARRRLRKLGFPIGEDSSGSSYAAAGGGTSAAPAVAGQADSARSAPEHAADPDLTVRSLQPQTQPAAPAVETAASAGVARTTAAGQGSDGGPHVENPSTGVPSSRRTAWMAAGIAALAAAGLAYKFLPDSATPARTNPAPASSAPAPVAVGASAAAVPASAPVSTASAVALTTAGKPAVSAASAPVAGASAAAAAKKATSDKDKAGNQAPAKATGPAPGPGPTPEPAHAGRAGAVLPAAPSAQTPHAESGTKAAATGSPRQACEDRSLLGFQSCMSEQCAKPAFANHAICVERRLMEQRRREAEQQRR